MLGKLLKYEIKATVRIFPPLFLALLIFAAITRLTSFIGPENWDTPAVISMVIYITIMTGMFVMAFIMMIQRFYKNLLSDEGYLTHTLPVKPWKHIVSKLLISIMWVLASGIVAFISVIIINFEKAGFLEFIRNFIVIANQVFGQLGISAYILSLEFIIGFFTSLALMVLVVYASIAIGHLFSQHKILASFGAFIVLNTISQIFFSIATWITGNIFSQLDVVSNQFLYQEPVIIILGIAYIILLAGIMCAAYFWVTNYILSNRLNLE